MSVTQRGCERFIACIVISGRAGLNYAESKERCLTWVFVMVEGRGQGEGSHTWARASCGSSLPLAPKGRSLRLFLSAHAVLGREGGGKARLKSRRKSDVEKQSDTLLQ